MNGPLVYGAAIGNVALTVCCLVALLLVALRARGRVRLLGIVGFSLLILSRLSGMVGALAPTSGVGGTVASLAATVLVAVLTTGGLVVLGLAFLPHRDRRPDSSNGAPWPGQVGP